MSTIEQYNTVAAQCATIFLKKTKDYGTSWRVLRTISVADQIMIKALRIRNLQQLVQQQVSDSITSEFIGIFNYAIIGLIQLTLVEPAIDELSYEVANELYHKHLNEAKVTMLQKNHDYGEAWRDMSQESFADLILVKLLRIRQIIANDGKTLISEGIDANYIDIVNYAAFALILIAEGKHKG
ncbi:MAG: DUF1599 domain-containing protein [Chitinophagaceae bacterium]|jgi:hypothetical protein